MKLRFAVFITAAVLLIIMFTSCVDVEVVTAATEENSSVQPVVQTQTQTSGLSVYPEETSAEETSAEANDVTSVTASTEDTGMSEVDLSISMPEANGEMHVDASSDNNFIQTVIKEKNISASLLVAVYSLPDTGQNYVFEFNSPKSGAAVSKTKNNLRRVYLIDASGTITSIAADKSSEKENLTSYENWFCMNVLIKGVVFPAIADNL